MNDKTARMAKHTPRTTQRVTTLLTVTRASLLYKRILKRRKKNPAYMK